VIRWAGEIVAQLEINPRVGAKLVPVGSSRRTITRLKRELRRHRRYLMAGVLPPGLGQGFTIEAEA